MDCLFVSVIIPNYNHARYLDERIQSVLNQTYQNFEVIILDDRSTDNSLEVINKYKNDAHISCIVVNEENSGSPFKQWHKGFDLAKGDLIWIAESDDKCDKDFLKTLIGFFIQEGRCALAYTDSVVFSDNDGSLVYPHEEKQSEVLPGKDFIMQRMICDDHMAMPILNVSSVLFRKSIALEIDRQYMDYRGAGDRLFWLEMSEQGYVGIDYHKLNYCRFHTNNSTKRNYYEGINQREDFRTLNYIKDRGYVSEKQYNRIKYNYVRWNVVSSKLSSKHRIEVLKLWNLRPSDLFEIILVNIYDILKYKVGQLKDSFIK